MKFNKRFKYLLPITVAGIGLMAASIISTNNLLGLNQNQWNIPYNSDTTYDMPVVNVPHPQNPPQRPGQSSNWFPLQYPQ